MIRGFVARRVLFEASPQVVSWGAIDFWFSSSGLPQGSLRILQCLAAQSIAPSIVNAKGGYTVGA